MQRHALHRRLVHVVILLLRGAVKGTVHLDHNHVRILAGHCFIELCLPHLHRIAVDGKGIARDAVVPVRKPRGIGTADITGTDQHHVQRILRLLIKADDPVLIVVAVDVQKVPGSVHHQQNGQ